MKFSLSIGLAVLSIGINAKELKADLIQKASTVTGQQDGKADPGQVKSDTSDENFINICAGKTLTNGKQIEAGSCNGIPMGDIPSKNNMVSSMIIFPKTGEPVKASQSFDIKVKVTNMVTGFFTNPLETYYAAPQKLEGGKVVGHTHVTVQDMGNTMNPDTPLAPDKFSFFKGINDKADGNGVLTATVTDGLPIGKYRICTLTSAANHQAVIMPVAQRGAQDDCTKFEVTVDGGSGGGNKAKDNKDDDSKNGGVNKAKDNKEDKSKNGGGNKAKANEADDSKNGGGNKAKANEADDSKNGGGNKAKANEDDKSKNGGGNKAKANEDDKSKANANNNGKNEEANKANSKGIKKSEKDDDDNDDDDKPKAKDKKPKVDKERAEKRAGATIEDCQRLARRATTTKTEYIDNLEGQNENKKVIDKQKRFSRVFVS